MDKIASEKSAGAYRTISEVAADLDLPQHVLRFWETRFPQVRPLKRAGGRRFYRPADVALLRDIRVKLHDEGYTIKGVQRLLRERGTRERSSSDADATVGATPPDTKGDGLINGNSSIDASPLPVMGEANAPVERGATELSGSCPESLTDSPIAAGGPAPSLTVLLDTLALVESCERRLRAALALDA